MAKKKQTKKESSHCDQEKADEECVALIRDYFERNDIDFLENDDNGVHLFSVVIATTESVISFVRVMTAVGSTGIKARCEIPLRVPKSRLAAALTFVNHMNSENLGYGTLVADSEDNRVAILNDCYASVIKSDVDNVMDDFFGSMISQAGVCGDRILEIISGGSLPESQDESEEESTAKESHARRESQARAEGPDGSYGSHARLFA